ncbi:PAS domain S-box protein [Pedobacter frigiditerrae]|uniref:histidine kinase n=1 Tax=Pedobacter frigiditerrae TaxID=2530452 RepID=A0A4R0N3E9_9SPHI|nr:PAS domain S-box protein [Pedobacter frigiditerrae]TCC94320.1 PAS domain S-box protein [Pedobacter frigiditerrae]
MIDKLKASKKLYLLIIVMTTAIVGIGLYGILELKKMHKRTQTLYADRVFPLQQLTHTQYNYTVGILMTAQRVKTKDISYAEGLELINKAEKSIAADWSSYMTTFLTPQENKLAVQSSALIKQLTKTIQKLKEVLKNDDLLDDSTFIDNELYPQINAVSTKLNRLITLQVRVGSEVYTSSNNAYDTALLESIFLIFLSLVLAFAFSYYLINNVRELIKNLKQNKEKYQSLLSHAGDPVFLLNKRGYFIEVNNSMCQLLGYTEKELLSMHLSQLFSAEDLEKQPLQLDLLEQKRTLLLEKRWLRKDGTRVAVEINTRVFEGIGYLAIARDITARIQTEEALRESERKYRNIFENVQDVFYQTSLEGILLEVSPSITKHLGYAPEEVIGEPTASLYYNLEDRTNALEMIRTDGEFDDYEVTFKSKSGEDVFVSMNARLICDADGKPSHLDGSFRNITERKRIENELAKHKEQLAIFIEHSPASLAMFDTEMRYIATSNRWKHENNASEYDLVGKSHYEIFPDVPQHWRDGHQRCLQGAVEKKEEDSFVHPDGKIDWIRWETRPWYKASGKIGGIIMLTEVITERKNATELFKQQFENSPDIILIINRDFKIESINRGFPGGRTVAELIGLDSISILPEESREIARASVKACLETGLPQESESAMSNGSLVRSRFVPIVFHGEISRVMVIATDITERRQAKEKLKKSEERHRALIENISDTIILINDKVEVIYQSPSFGRSAGFTKEELKGKTILDFMYPADVQKSKEDLQKAKDSPGIPQHIQYRIIHKLGHYIWIEGTMTNLLHNDSVNAYIVIYRDITERKIAEQERTSMTADIIQRNKDLEQFAYIISHNLRAPVANVIGITDLLHLPGLSEIEKEEMMEALSLNVTKLDNVIKDLNHILQVKREVSEKKGVVQLSKLLKDVEASILNMITQENVSITSDFSAIDHLTTLKSYLYSVFFNLIANSIKYKRDGVNPQIEVTSELSGNMVTLIFRDNGLGIDLQKYEDEIFGLYKRFHLHTEGKGIGLFMVKTQVETLGGKISIKSEPNKGSEFIIEFETEESQFQQLTN